MGDISIKQIAAHIESGDLSQKGAVKEASEGSFGEVINEALSKVSQVQNNVDQAVSELATGGDVTNAMLAVEKADMSFQLMVEVRNKLIKTYEEVMRMPV